MVLFTGCNKDLFEPDVEGTWIELNNTTDQVPTGCELVIDRSAGEVSLCGFKFVHPHNVVAAFVRQKARLVIQDGQMFYRQKKADILWIAPIAREDLYFIDYEFEGEFLWIVGDDTDSKKPAKGTGKVFKKK
jgi:hypothetical protein